MRRLGLGLALALLVVAVSCGVPEDDQPQELSADQVPFGLLTTPTTTTTPLQAIPLSRRGELYFVNTDGQVTPVVREVDSQSPEDIITALLEADPTGLGSGLTSNIPPETTLLDITQEDDVLTVDLSDEFTTIIGGSSIAAVAQIVFTATAIEGIAAVSFRVEGDPLDVLDEESAAQRDPVSRNDYASLLAP